MYCFRPALFRSKTTLIYLWQIKVKSKEAVGRLYIMAKDLAFLNWGYFITVFLPWQEENCFFSKKHG